MKHICAKESTERRPCDFRDRKKGSLRKGSFHPRARRATLYPLVRALEVARGGAWSPTSMMAPSTMISEASTPQRHMQRGLFTGGTFRISKFSRISRKWSASPLFSTVWRFSKISRTSRFSKISRKWTFLKRPLLPKDPFFRTRDLWGGRPLVGPIRVT